MTSATELRDVQWDSWTCTLGKIYRQIPDYIVNHLVSVLTASLCLLHFIFIFFFYFHHYCFLLATSLFIRLHSRLYFIVSSILFNVNHIFFPLFYFSILFCSFIFIIYFILFSGWPVQGIWPQGADGKILMFVFFSFLLFIVVF